MSDAPANTNPDAHPDAHSDAAETHHLVAQRRANRDAVAALGMSPYGLATQGLVDIAAARAAYDPHADADHQAKSKEPGYVDRRPSVRVAGRVMLHRDNGKLVWLQLRDHTSLPDADGGAGAGDLQAAVSQRDCDEASFALAKAIDMGDIVVASGPLMKTRTGEVTVWAKSLEMGAKSLAPPPEKWAGLQDVELRYRKRYVDLYANPRAMRIAQQRSRIVTRIRRFLDERGFLEVETPILQAQAGGAAARPFATHLNAWDIDVFLRIAPELYLKRLLVGGMPRVYEMNRNFRNEGVDRQHNPEFTMLEVYEAFGDYTTMMDLVESLVREVAVMVAMEREDAGDPASEDAMPADLRLPFGELTIDYAEPFDRVAYRDLFARALGFEPEDTRRVREAIGERGLARRIKGAALKPGATDAEAREALHRIDAALLVNTLFEEVAEPTLDPAHPSFIIEYPSALSPLTRPNPERPEVADRADLFIGGMEIGPMYTELNDPDVQEAKFRQQLAGLDDEESTFRTLDHDFLEALKVGMPPAGGLGVGVDRVAMLMTNQPSIRDVVLFPFMRPV